MARRSVIFSSLVVALGAMAISIISDILASTLALRHPYLIFTDTAILGVVVYSWHYIRNRYRWSAREQSKHSQFTDTTIDAITLIVLSEKTEHWMKACQIIRQDAHDVHQGEIAGNQRAAARTIENLPRA